MKRLVAAALLVIAPASVFAQPLPCGTVLTTDFTLTGDMACVGTALVIAADGITVDLGGHTVSGHRTLGSAGVENVGWRNVTIQNGTVADFFYGIHLEGASSNTIRWIAADHNVLSGIFLETSDENRIEDCVVTDNGTLPSYPGNGITINTSKGNLVTRTMAARNRTQGIFVGGGNGTAASSDTRILNNSSQDNTANGIGILGGSGHVVTGNTSIYNGSHGISFSSTPVAGRVTQSSITGNAVTSNRKFGIELRNADRNRVTANRIDGSGFSGIAVIDTSGGNVITANRATGSANHGLFVAGATNNVFRGNEFDANGLRGILVTHDPLFGMTGHNTFEGNHATDNGVRIVIGIKFDVRDQTIGSGTAGTDSTYRGTRCDLANPAAICVP